jgi:hypothetical protein
VLADQAREMIARIGYPEPPGDSAYAYSVDGDYIQWKAARDKSMERWRDLRSGMPPVVQLWYRQSPQPLISSALSGRVFWGNPPMLFTGMAGVRLDPRGNLLEFYAVPPQVADSGPALRAGLGPAVRGGEAGPRAVQGGRAALDAAFVRGPARGLGRTPAGATRHHDSRGSRFASRPAGVVRADRAVDAPVAHGAVQADLGSGLIAATVGSLLLVCGLVAGGALAWRNLRLGRVDHARRGDGHGLRARGRHDRVGAGGRPPSRVQPRADLIMRGSQRRCATPA